MTYTEAAAALNALESEMHAYTHAMGILTVDGSTAAPKKSSAGRADTLGVLSGLYYRAFVNDGVKETLETILTADDADPVVRRRAEVLKEDLDDLTRLPMDEFVAYQTLLAQADAAWHAAKEADDFPAFLPYLEKLIDFSKRTAARKDASRHPYDVILDGYEKGTTTAMLDPFFALLREKLTPVILAVKDAPRPDFAFLHDTYPVHEQEAFSHRLMALMGIDPDRCTLTTTEHPFTEAFSRDDVRITTHYHEDSVLSSMFSVIHEGGHALYELGVDRRYDNTCLGCGTSMSIHESQSRFYENIIGRSRAFMDALLPLMRESFPAQMKAVTADDLYRAANLSSPSLIRTEADELTYAAHIMIRYELEKAMITDALAVKDLPGEWNRLYKEYLGVDVPDDRRGCLQDTHWASGLFGYFPSYALGSAYGVQYLQAMEKETDVWGSVARGDLSPVTGWLGDRIHRHGKFLTPVDVFRQAVGAPFDAQHYVDYLTRKYSALYSL